MKPCCRVYAKSVDDLIDWVRDATYLSRCQTLARGARTTTLSSTKLEVGIEEGISIESFGLLLLPDDLRVVSSSSGEKRLLVVHRRF